MTYTFPFFSLGFLVPVVVQILTRWAAGLEKEIKFASQQFWTAVIALVLLKFRTYTSLTNIIIAGVSDYHSLSHRSLSWPP